MHRTLPALGANPLPSIYRDGHRLATSYINSPSLYQILCRRIIERKWFPTANRQGYNAERPDSHWILEQWIPFDYSNQSSPDEVTAASDFLQGRLGDWRTAPSDWSIYQPDHDNYQVPGNCRRKIARCLNIGTRNRLLNQGEVSRAFDRANRGFDTVLAFANHDFRDITEDIQNVRQMLKVSQTQFLGVRFYYCDAIEAMRCVSIGDAELKAESRIQINAELIGNTFYASLKSGQTFGPQPFLALHTWDNRFIHDNFDSLKPGEVGSYVFDDHSVPLSALRAIGVASNDHFGNSDVRVLEL